MLIVLHHVKNEFYRNPFIEISIIFLDKLTNKELCSYQVKCNCLGTPR